MIELVRRVLEDLALIRKGEACRYSILLTTGACIVVEVHGRSGRFFHVKASELEALEDEFEAVAAGWSAFSDYMARPFGHFRLDGWEFIVSEGVRHRAVFPGVLESAKGRVPRAILGFLQATASGRPVEAEGNADCRRFLAGISEVSADRRSREVLVEWSERDEIAALPRVVQHGDFVVNNLGLARGRLVVFDWEDFGKVCIPGFDLCTLLLSDCRFEHDRFRSFLEGAPDANVPAQVFIARACAASRIERDVFRRLVPLYLALFLQLKGGYSLAVQEALGRLLGLFRA